MKTLHPVKFCSHLPLLMAVMARTDGSVLELGMGYGSSLYLHWACAARPRDIVSYENSPEWYENFGRHFARHGYVWHQVLSVDDFALADIERPWSVAFIDSSPAKTRVPLIRRLADWADYIVIHDTEARVESEFQYDRIYPLFRWRYDYADHAPYSAVLSNRVDLTDFHI